MRSIRSAYRHRSLNRRRSMLPAAASSSSSSVPRTSRVRVCTIRRENTTGAKRTFLLSSRSRDNGFLQRKSFNAW